MEISVFSRHDDIAWSIRDLWKALFTTFFLVFLLNSLLSFIDFESFFRASERKSLLALSLFLLQTAFFIFPVIFFILQKYNTTKVMIGFRPLHIWTVIRYALTGYFFVIFLNFLLYTMTGGKVLPGLRDQQSYFELFGGVQSQVDIAIAIFVLVILAPVIEEIVFRGIMLQTLMKHFGMGRGNVMTALFFALIHFQFESFFLLLILSFVLNWIFIKTRSIYATIAFHIFNNSLAFLMQWLIFTGKINIENIL